MPRRSRNNNINAIDPTDDNSVSTPYGEGMLIGKSERFVMDSGKSKKVIEYMVRILINDNNVNYVTDSNCLTKHAKISAIWAFEKGMLEKLNPKLKLAESKE